MFTQRRDIEKGFLEIAGAFKINDEFSISSELRYNHVVIKYDVFNISSITALCKFMSNIKLFIIDYDIFDVYLKDGAYTVDIDLSKIDNDELQLDIKNSKKQLMKDTP